MPRSSSLRAIPPTADAIRACGFRRSAAKSDTTPERLFSLEAGLWPALMDDVGVPQLMHFRAKTTKTRNPMAHQCGGEQLHLLNSRTSESAIPPLRGYNKAKSIGRARICGWNRSAISIGTSLSKTVPNTKPPQHLMVDAMSPQVPPPQDPRCHFSIQVLGHATKAEAMRPLSNPATFFDP
jgi:hypothetical protein